MCWPLPIINIRSVAPAVLVSGSAETVLVLRGRTPGWFHLPLRPGVLVLLARKGTLCIAGLVVTGYRLTCFCITFIVCSKQLKSYKPRSVASWFLVIQGQRCPYYPAEAALGSPKGKVASLYFGLGGSEADASTRHHKMFFLA